MVGQLLCAALLAALLHGCGAAATASIGPSSGPVRTGTDAVARVIAAEPRFGGLQPFDTALVGQSSWYVVEPASGVGAFLVTVHIGWGDCEAGCIDAHEWVFAVKPDGSIDQSSESGPNVPPNAWPTPVAPGKAGLWGTASAGPVCPVEMVPPDPNCAPRKVANAQVTVVDARGAEVARVFTDTGGEFFVELPPGEYSVVPASVDGLLGVAAPQDVQLTEGDVSIVQLEYDTGIR